jgi:hypothetical protein
MHGSQMIYATRLSSPRGKYNPVFRGIFAAMLVIVALAWQGAAQTGAQWREAPDYLATFGPAGPRRSLYRAYVAGEDLDSVLRQLDLGSGSSSAWTAAPVAPGDAFGQAGTYDRSTLARLYGSVRPRVARGMTVVDGRQEFWTLISPHPDPTLRRLEKGTLLLVLRYDPANPPR